MSRRKWFLSEKDYYKAHSYGEPCLVKLVLSKDLKKDFPYENISDVYDNCLMRFVEEETE